MFCDTLKKCDLELWQPRLWGVTDVIYMFKLTDVKHGEEGLNEFICCKLHDYIMRPDSSGSVKPGECGEAGLTKH